MWRGMIINPEAACDDDGIQAGERGALLACRCLALKHRGFAAGLPFYVQEKYL